MGEHPLPPQENNPRNEEQMEAESEEAEELAELSLEEYEQLDSKMDELNSALDAIEQRNDDIYSQLLKLLDANRELRAKMHGKNVEVSQPNNQEASDK